VSPNRYAYIDALRGYAILMVIAVHSTAYFADLPFEVLANQGARGVQLFFVVSALTLCMSWKARNDGALPFYVRRFFRIAPMFYLAILFFLWARGFGPNEYAPDGLGLRHVLMAATFTHGLMPDTITSVVPGSWSIADEMMFYALFPLLVVGLNRVRFSTAAVAAIVISYLCFLIQQPAYHYVANMTDPAWRAAWANFTFLWFVQQLPCFLFGMLAFKWTVEGGTVPSPRTLVALSLVAMVLLAFFPTPPYVGRLGLPAQYGFLFALFALGLMHWSPWFLVNPVIGWIGKVSFSAYLVHFAAMSTLPIPHANYAEAFVSLAAITTALSSITYFCVEQPFTQLGRRVAKRRAAAREIRTERDSMEPALAEFPDGVTSTASQ
jgi:peptidoglycan/LPS O-acetylase OafA/YrhL